MQSTSKRDGNRSKQPNQKGQTLKQFAAEHGFPLWQVYAVSAGRNKGNWGRAHEIAVALGLK